ncbi:MAG: FAD-dependent oxidoreductase, partial [Myxococcales bacterium]|nr:FAD-dependent oxidoreductase [Myxococcales bacterium]
MHVVIVGNGVAGTEAATLLRSRDRDCRITVVSEESDHFFSRTALMYVVSGQMSYRDIEPLERDVCARLGFERVRARVTGLDPERKLLTLASGEPLAYDRLLIACGSEPRRPPWRSYEALQGVGHLVTMQDLEWLEEEVHGRSAVDAPPRAREHETDLPSPYKRRKAAAATRGHRARKPLIVGGGLIGIESVEIMLAAGLRPTFVVREEWFWPIALDAREGTWIAEELRHHGVDVKLGANVRDLVGKDGLVTGVDTDQGPIEADLVVVAIGVVPNTAWLGDAVRRDPGGGILVDEHLRTSAPDVWAAGDCASVRWFDGRVRPEQLWYTGRDQGRIAGRQLAGEVDAAYVRGTWYNSAKLMDIEYTTAG